MLLPCQRVIYLLSSSLEAQGREKHYLRAVRGSAGFPGLLGETGPFVLIDDAQT